MKKSDLADFKKLLLMWQARLRGDVEQLASGALGTDRQDDGDSKSPTHMAELGSESFEQDFALLRVVNEQETLAEIAAALEKIEKGTYGECEGCLKDGKTGAAAMILKERLQVIPYAKYCVACARVLENSTS